MFINDLFTNPVFFFRYIVIIILSICIHELAHGVAALSQGDDTPNKSGHMTMNPVVHMGWESMLFLVMTGMCWGKMPVNPAKFRSPKFGSILVAAAGPLSNLALAVLFIVLIKLSFLPFLSGFLSFQFLLMAAQINLILCMLNLIPIPPLDGFHVLSEIFPALKPMENSPFALLALMIVFLGGLTSVLGSIAVFLIATGSGL